jgi:hypothetical protein
MAVEADNYAGYLKWRIEPVKLICRELSVENDGIPGSIAHPDRKEPGPGIFIVHHHYGVNRPSQIRPL